MTKIAIPTRNNVVDDHFGHCDHYTVFTIDDPSTGSGQAPNIISVERLDSPQGCGCKSNIAFVMQEMGITIMLAGNMGMGAFNKLSMHGISVVRGCHGNIEDVLKAYLNGSIADSAESCSHHDCGELMEQREQSEARFNYAESQQKKAEGQHEEKPVFIIPNMK